MTMRAVLIVLILLVLVALAGIVTGFININQIRGAQAPEVSATHNGIVAKGGQTPAFDVQTGSVELGTHNTTVQMPSVEVKRPAQVNSTDNQVNAM
jgi:uncharacterized protein involved in outer membrane biogenesis